MMSPRNRLVLAAIPLLATTMLTACISRPVETSSEQKSATAAAQANTADLAAGKLPAVSFYKPAGRDNQHPSYTNIMRGDTHIAEVLEKLRASAQWNDMLIVVTYDENDGYWDHVPPPTGAGWGDRWGPGSRVPTIIVGPYVTRGYIDSNSMDTTSILKMITQRFELEPLPGVRAKTGNLFSALQ